MRVDVEIEAVGGPARVVLSGADTGQIWGKYVFGRLKSRPEVRVLVFDDRAEFHKDIAIGQGIEVSGGGWIEFDQTNRCARVGGRSTQFGREPDRGFTVDLLERALPDYRVEDVS